MAKTFEEWYAEYDDTKDYDAGMKDAWHARDAEIANLRSRIEAITEALSNLLSAHHHSRGDEWVDAAYLALGPADETKREGRDTELRAQIFAEGWVPVNQVAEKVNQARLEEADIWDTQFASNERAGNCIGIKQWRKNRLANLRAAVGDSDPRK